MIRRALFSAAVWLLICGPHAEAKDDQLRQIPDEYETTSGNGVAMNNGGYAATDGFSAVRANPALIAAQKDYTVSAGYNWPVAGRDYYQVGVVDAKTQASAMGVTYTAFTDDYAYEKNNPQASAIDSPVVRRGQFALAQPMGSVLVGAGATYVEAHSLPGSAENLRGQQIVKGVGLNAGAALSVTQQLSLGASVENASNRAIKDYAPRTFRAGLAYMFVPQLRGYLDVRQRDRVFEFEAPKIDILNPTAAKDDHLMDEPERLVIASLSAQIQDYLRLIGSYAQSGTDSRRSLAGGVALINRNFSLSYTAARPYMKSASAHQAVTLSFEMAM